MRIITRCGYAARGRIVPFLEARLFCAGCWGVQRFTVGLDGWYLHLLLTLVKA